MVADPPNVMPSGPDPGTPAPGLGPGQPRASSATSSLTSLLDATVAKTFGNLPVDTQRFLLHPFVQGQTKPQSKGQLVEATTEGVGRDYVETILCFLFSGSWLAVGEAVRSVPLVSGLSGPALWHGSPEARQLAATPWRVAAWYAPVLKPGRPLPSHAS